MTDSPPATSNLVGADLVRSFIERLERVREDKDKLNDFEKEIYAEAKSQGLVARYLKGLLKLRKLPPSQRDEDEAMMAVYTSAVGMARELPLFRHVGAMGVDTAAAEHVINALKLLAPEDGEITIRVPGAPRMRIWRDKAGTHAGEAPEPRAEPQSREPKNRPTAAPRDDVPDCTLDEAYDLGRQARQDDAPIITNPFPWDDKRRRRWDEGWRAEDGGDGMGPR